MAARGESIGLKKIRLGKITKDLNFGLETLAWGGAFRSLVR